MPKEALKRQVIEAKGSACAITNQPLPDIVALFDTHRPLPKKDNGTYTLDNTFVVDPIAHMIEHGNYRERTEELDKLKTLIDDRSQIMKLKNKVNNQLLAYKRGVDVPRDATVDFLETLLKTTKSELGKHDRNIEKHIKLMVSPLAKAALGVPSIGPITVSYCMSYIDLGKARHASSLWAYCGLDKPSHSRYEKGVAGGGNKTLRTILYTMADSQVKGRGPYRAVYDNVKHRLEHSEKMVESRDTAGKMVKVAWKDTKPCHRHGAALRAIMKHFLADYWMVGRTLAGLPTSALYPEAILGGTHRTIMPEERGWVY